MSGFLPYQRRAIKTATIAGKYKNGRWLSVLLSLAYEYTNTEKRKIREFICQTA